MDASGDQNQVATAVKPSRAEAVAKPINVALLVDADYLYRLGSVFGHMLVGLVDQPINVSVVCPDPEALSHLPTGPATLLAYRPPFWPRRRRRDLSRLVRQLEGAKVNLIHSCCGGLSNLAYDLAEMMDRPYIVSVTGLLQKECFWRLSSYRCRALIAISEPIRAMLSEAYHHLADRVHLVRPGCFRHPHAPRETNGHVKTIVSRGRFDRGAGYDLLLRALKRLADQQVDFLAFLFGSGPIEPMMRRWVRRSKLGSQVTFLDPIMNWQRALDDADVYVQPGVLHQLHSGPYEAMVRGCPIVTTSDTAFDLITDGETGRVFPLGDEDALVAILSEWLDDSELGASLSARAGSLALDVLSPHESTAKLVDIYRAVLNDAG